MSGFGIQCDGMGTSRATLAIRVASPFLFACKQQLLGYEINIGGGTLRRYPPAKFPYKNQTLYCTEIISIQGVGFQYYKTPKLCTNQTQSPSDPDYQFGGLTQFDEYIVQAQFETLPFEVPSAGANGYTEYNSGNMSTAYINVTQAASAQVVDIDKNSYEFVSDGTNVQSGMKLTLPMTTYQVEWKRVPVAYVGTGFAYPNLKALEGKVNSATFLGFATETLLFGGYEEDKYMSWDGVQMTNITMHMYNRNSPTWQEFIAPSGAVGRLQTRASPNRPLFPVGDFSTLFTGV